jgi:hypothetical protein
VALETAQRKTVCSRIAMDSASGGVSAAKRVTFGGTNHRRTSTPSARLRAAKSGPSSAHTLPLSSKSKKRIIRSYKVLKSAFFFDTTKFPFELFDGNWARGRRNEINQAQQDDLAIVDEG